MYLLMMVSQPQGGGEGAGYMAFLPFVLIFAVFYFLLIRPQAKRQKHKLEMLKAIVKGDKIVTVGGLHGTVEGVKEKDEVLVVKLADNIKVNISRSAVASKVGDK